MDDEGDESDPSNELQATTYRTSWATVNVQMSTNLTDWQSTEHTFILDQQAEGQWFYRLSITNEGSLLWR